MALASALGKIIAAILTSRIGDELRAWMPWFTKRLLRLAIERLPEAQRERFSEEWTSHVNEMPGEIARVWVALGCVFASHTMAQDLPSPNDQSVEGEKKRWLDERAWWDLWNVSYRSRDDGDEISKELFARIGVVIDNVSPSAGGRVLEIGCGTGTLARRLRYAHYHGIDISPAAIEFARQKNSTIPRLNADATSYEAADFHEWPLPRESFNVVVCVNAIASFRDEALKKMAQPLRPGGVLVLTTINLFVYDRIQRTTKTSPKQGPVSHWRTRSELHRLVESSGLTIEESYTIMPRGTLGLLRIVNSRILDRAFGRNSAKLLKRTKEHAGLGQYWVIVARKLD